MGRGVIAIFFIKVSYYLTSFYNFIHRAPKVVTGAGNGAKMYELNSIEVYVETTVFLQIQKIQYYWNIWCKIV